MGQSVLLVEENPLSRKMVRLALAGDGYDVIEAHSGHDALQQADHASIDLVLQDMLLRDFDGLALFHQLRLTLGHARTPFVALGGTDVKKLRSAGFSEVLPKPIEPKRVLLAVREHLGHTDNVMTDDLPTALEDVFAGSDSVTIDRLQRHATRYAELAQRDRVWRAASQIIECAGALSSGPMRLEEALHQVIEAVLEACGITMGAALTINKHGRLRVAAQLGFHDDGAWPIGQVWGLESLFKSIIAVGEIYLLAAGDPSPIARAVAQRTGVASLMLVPLSAGGRCLGALVLGSANEGEKEWISVASAVRGPLAQTIALMYSVETLRASEQRFRGVAESSADGIVLGNNDGAITYVNPAGAKILGLEAESMIGRRLGEVAPPLDDQRATFAATIVRGEGEHILVETEAHSFEDAPGIATRVHILRDLSEKSRVQELAHIASHDQLTGLFNRRRFEEAVERGLAEYRRYQEEGVLLVLDLDGFKRINDLHGHQAGDRVLIAIGEMLKRNTRETDVIARFGGDEFVVLAPRTNEAAARVVAGKLLHAISTSLIPYGETTLRVGVSVGVAQYPKHGATFVELFGAADAALYCVKRAGKGAMAFAG